MAKEEVVPGIELGLPESESDVLTITLYNHDVGANPRKVQYKLPVRATQESVQIRAALVVSHPGETVIVVYLANHELDIHT